jgi:hypothetical protein
MFIFLLALQFGVFVGGVFACRHLHWVRTGQAKGFSMGEAVHFRTWTGMLPGIFWMFGIVARTLQSGLVSRHKSWNLPVTPLEWLFSLGVIFCFAAWVIGTVYAIKIAKTERQLMEGEAAQQGMPDGPWYGERK